MKVKKDLISIYDLSVGEIRGILAETAHLKEKLHWGERTRPLEGKALGMIFQKPSTRTRVSFEVGMYQLGGHALFLSASELQLGRGETVADTARTLSRYVDGVMIRTFRHGDVLDLARYASVPVINGLTDLLHPCQVLGDIFTIIEHFGKNPEDPDLKDLKVVFVGDGNNVANSWVFGAAKLGMALTLCPPSGYEPDEEVMRKGKELAAETGASIRIVNDPIKAVAGADVVYTDVWASMGQEAEREERMQAFQPYQVNAALLRRAGPNVKVMHCLPAHRGEELTDEVMDGHHSIVFDQAENRLHVQKGILAILMA